MTVEQRIVAVRRLVLRIWFKLITGTAGVRGPRRMFFYPLGCSSRPLSLNAIFVGVDRFNRDLNERVA
jgi:hypothetical protein